MKKIFYSSSSPAQARPFSFPPFPALAHSAARSSLLLFQRTGLLLPGPPLGLPTAPLAPRAYARPHPRGPAPPRPACARPSAPTPARVAPLLPHYPLAPRRQTPARQPPARVTSPSRCAAGPTPSAATVPFPFFPAPLFPFSAHQWRGSEGRPPAPTWKAPNHSAPLPFLVRRSRPPIKTRARRPPSPFSPTAARARTAAGELLLPSANRRRRRVQEFHRDPPKP